MAQIEGIRREVAIDIPDYPPHADDATEEFSGSLTDLQKRWLIVGICIHSILSPVLRDFVKPVFETLYNTLVTNDSIDTQTYDDRMKHYPINGEVKLNYECINNNKVIKGPDRQKGFDYTVHTAVDLSRLFLQTHMCFHTGFDDSCDSSALVTFIINVDDFDVQQRACAQKFKDEIRNDWAHCNFLVWTEQKLEASFGAMADFIKSLKLPSDKETEVLNKLTEWKVNGKSFLSGSKLGLELVRSLMVHIVDLRSHMRKLALQTTDEFNEVFKVFRRIEQNLSTFETELKSIKETLVLQQDSIADLDTRMTVNEDRCLTFDARISNLEQKNSQNSGKKLFLVPCRIEFVGRTEHLTQIEEKLLGSNQTTNKLALCGLGGIGKTSIVVEYVWKTHSDHYPGGVFWISGENGEAYENSIRSLAAVIGTIGNERSDTHAVTFNWISLRQGRCLIVIDNVDEEVINPSIMKLVTQHNELVGNYNHIIITTRRSSVKANLDFSCNTSIPINELLDSESIMLVKTTLGLSSDEYNHDIADLCTELQGLPLAIEQAATTIRQVRCTVAAFLKDFRERRVQLLNNPLPYNVSSSDDINRQSVRTTWTINIENIKKKAYEQNLSKAIDLLLPLLSRLARDDIIIDIFNEGDPKFDDEHLTTIFCSEFRKCSVIYLFTEYSILIENSDGTYRIHSLVQDIIRTHYLCDDDRLHYVARCAVSMLNKALHRASGDSDTIVLVKLEKQCAALKIHLGRFEDINLDLTTLEVRCMTMIYNKTSHRLREIGDMRPARIRPEQEVFNIERERGDEVRWVVNVLREVGDNVVSSGSFLPAGNPVLWGIFRVAGYAFNRYYGR